MPQDPTAFPRRAIPNTAIESQWHARDGHAIRRIDWPVSGAGQRGSILFLPGRCDYYEKYLETLDGWSEQGWNVTASDWRGQSGSGRFSAELYTGDVPDFGIWVDDLAQLWARWIAETPGPHVLIAHSMGGHLAMRAVAEGKITPDALVLSTPMLGFLDKRVPAWVMHAAAWMMTKLGDPKRQAWKWGEKPRQLPEGRELLLTHDMHRYADEIWWREHRPYLAMGPASWRWVERAYASVRGLGRKGLLESLQLPVLIVGTDHDGLVSFAAIEDYVRRLPQGELCRFGPEARHEILREIDPVRDKALAAISAFLDRTVPGRP